jgi:hypothetical protein
MTMPPFPASEIIGGPECVHRPRLLGLAVKVCWRNLGVKRELHHIPPKKPGDFTRASVLVLYDRPGYRLVAAKPRRAGSQEGIGTTLDEFVSTGDFS